MIYEGPEYEIALWVLIGVGVLVFYRVLRWVFSGPLKTDPWGEQIATQLDAPESAPVCHRCLTEHSELNHFCPRCGAAVGECNNLLPFERLFSIGEVLRNGTTLRLRRSFVVVAGYLVLPLVIGLMLSTLLFLYALVYWFLVFENLFGRSDQPPVLETTP